MKRSLAAVLLILTVTDAQTLEEALKYNDYAPKGGVVVSPPRTESHEANRKEHLLLQKRVKYAMHPINMGVLSLQKTQRAIEKRLSEDIKRLFFLPKSIKVKSEIKRDKIYTRFIYRFEE